ncbi:C40 family peptidase [Actinomadura gamaensis]|uniref:C40 family peptidase n=1 Tax=Actinomadura gamaensis TaxID=1763541 RepID=A0ABV9UC05_9ACTN
MTFGATLNGFEIPQGPTPSTRRTAAPAGRPSGSPGRRARGALALGALCAAGSVVLATAPAEAAPDTTAVTSASTAAKQRSRAAVAVRFAYRHIGDPYRWGGNGPHAWDCSGLVVGAWRKAGVRLPRTTQSIYRAVPHKVSWSHLQPGDLVFFYSGRTHVGIYIGHGYMIHSPHSGTTVRKARLAGYYKREFAGAVRPGY